MTRAVRWFGLVLFMASIGLLGWWWAHLASVGGVGVSWSAAVVDGALFSAFALHHSVLARSSARSLVERVVAADLARTVYVCVASLLLAGMCLLWRPVGGLVYHASGLTAAVLGIVQISGGVIAVLAVRRISVRELSGLSGPRPTDELQHGGPYGLVRHPLYLGWVLLLFGTATMTGDRLVFATISTAYLLLAMPFEEAGLLAQFGERYLEYRREVRWRLVPYVH